MKKILAVIMFVLSVLFVYSMIVKHKGDCQRSESASEGVIVHGCSSEGWIKNTNEFPVRIKQVWVFRGESTQWIKVFQPGEQKNQFISHQHGFHIYTMDDVEIGWIKSQKK